MSRFVALVALLAVQSAFAAEYTVYAGAGSGAETWSFSKYYPSDLKIHAGDSVKFVMAADEPHTITFPGTPAINLVSFDPSVGSLVFDPSFFPLGDNIVESPSGEVHSTGIFFNMPAETNTRTYTFPNEGLFDYQCVLHPGMFGMVEVVSGDVAIASPEEVDSAALAEIVADESLIATLDIVHSIHSDAPSRESEDGESRIYTVRVGVADLALRASRLKFVPSNLTIEVGDTIEFVQGDLMIHNVFLNSTGDGNDPEYPATENFDPNTGKLIVNPMYLQPTCDNSNYTGGFCTTGLALLPAFWRAGPSTFTVTFTEAGLHHFECSIHDELGMNGYVDVVEPEEPEECETCEECEECEEPEECDDEEETVKVNTQINFNFGGMIPENY